MQIGIDLGATKIEYVLIDNDSKELIRNRVRTPNNYNSTISEIISIVKNLEDNNKGLNIGQKGNKKRQGRSLSGVGFIERMKRLAAEKENKRLEAEAKKLREKV